MLDTNKDKMYIMYNDIKCKFIPDNNNNNISEVKGKVLYIDKGSYNPNYWYKDVIVNVNKIIS